MFCSGEDILSLTIQFADQSEFVNQRDRCVPTHESVIRLLISVQSAFYAMHYLSENNLLRTYCSYLAKDWNGKRALTLSKRGLR